MRRVVTAATWVCCAALPAMPAAAQQAQQVATHGGAPHASRYEPMKLPAHARTFYQSVRGVDNLSVRRTASGNLLRFSYRVTDPALAKLLGDESRLVRPLESRQRVQPLNARRIELAGVA